MCVTGLPVVTGVGVEPLLAGREQAAHLAAALRVAGERSAHHLHRRPVEVPGQNLRRIHREEHTMAVRQSAFQDLDRLLGFVLGSELDVEGPVVVHMSLCSQAMMAG